MAFDFTLGSNRVQKSSDRLLQKFRTRMSASLEMKFLWGGGIMEPGTQLDLFGPPIERL